MDHDMQEAFNKVRKAAKKLGATIQEYEARFGDNDDFKTMLSLIDGASVIVELWDAQSPSQVEWKRNWLDKSNKLLSKYTGN